MDERLPICRERGRRWGLMYVVFDWRRRWQAIFESPQAVLQVQRVRGAGKEPPSSYSQSHAHLVIAASIA